MCIGHNKSSQTEDGYKQKLAMLSFSYMRRWHLQWPEGTNLPACLDTSRKSCFSHGQLITLVHIMCLKQ
jgi:hypothetical protein